MVEPPYGINHDYPCPPRVHPEFQGSVPSRFMDRNSGLPPRKRMVETHNRSGFDGVCAYGLGGFMNDNSGKLYQDKSIAKMANPMQTRHSAIPWGEREYGWRPGKNTGYHICKAEPEAISKRPPYVARRGDFVLYHSATCLQSVCDDLEAERFGLQLARMNKAKEMKRQRAEARRAQEMVQGLEEWERDHLGPARPKAIRSGLGASASSPNVLASTGSRTVDAAPKRSASSTAGQFSRAQQA